MSGSLVRSVGWLRVVGACVLLALCLVVGRNWLRSSSQATPAARSLRWADGPAETTRTRDAGSADVDNDARQSSRRPGNAPISGAIVYLAASKGHPFESMSSGRNINRRRLLASSLLSLQRNFFDSLGYSYPIIIFHEDLDADDVRKFRAAVPNMELRFEQIDLLAGVSTESPLSESACDELNSRGADGAVLQRWSSGEDFAVKGRPPGYRAMCRAWSGPLQAHPALDDFEYYLRLDDDSLFPQPIKDDPFVFTAQRKLAYVWRAHASDSWGIEQMNAFLPFVRHKYAGLVSSSLETGHRFGWLDRTHDGERYNGRQPYNNFHLSRVDLWRSPLMRALFREADALQGFMRYRWGDANVHALFLMLAVEPSKLDVWTAEAYRHNYHFVDAGTSDFAFNVIADDDWVENVHGFD